MTGKANRLSVLFYTRFQTGFLHTLSLRSEQNTSIWYRTCYWKRYKRIWVELFIDLYLVGRLLYFSVVLFLCYLWCFGNLVERFIFVRFWMLEKYSIYTYLQFDKVIFLILCNPLIKGRFLTSDKNLRHFRFWLFPLYGLQRITWQKHLISWDIHCII